MRQRAAICRALIHDPTLLLMGEPFSALDAMTRDEMGLELLRIWQANRKSVLFVTHSIREAAFLSDPLSVRYSRARVSLPTQAARPGPDNHGKPRLFDLERRIPARDKFAPDSPLEETVTSELVSEAAKFPASRELTGIFFDAASEAPDAGQNPATNSKRCSEIPYHSEQGIQFDLTGKQIARSGN
jgi:ABC-type cobalamin/Fe3+-siderophores transport system ATPase subunit